MIVYELSHIIRRHDDLLYLEPLFLGFYSSYESVQSAIRHFVSQPGFRDNKEGFSIRRREVNDQNEGFVVYEALVYFHTDDFELEHVIEMGLFGDENVAHDVLGVYSQDNTEMTVDHELIREDMVIPRVLDKREWEEGFSF